MSGMDDTVHPYPGLRPFRDDETFLFFGRDEPVDVLLERLRRQRFLAVVGTSGSGKSSLVRAGLLPALQGGFMAGALSGWRIADMRPGSDPIGNLARALKRTWFPDTESAEEEVFDFTETTLRRGPLGLVEAVQLGNLGKGEHLLVLVDQFEELFRFESLRGRPHVDDATAFVRLLLEAVQQDRRPIYVVLTMRSDFLGDCARYRGLPAAMDAGQYLIPRLTRDQLRQAIVGPAAVGGAKVTSRLVQRLLAEVGDDPDQLPVLQHALMRTWNQRTELGEDGEPLDLSHYLAIGGLQKALSQHADQAFEELDTRGRWIAERIFRRLTEMNDKRGIRRPTQLEELCLVASASQEDVSQVIEVFRRPGRSFLMPPAGETLAPETPIDISHESLMRVWTRLRHWIQQESLSANRYRRLEENARLYGKDEAALLSDPELSSLLTWRATEQPNAIWASRYGDGFEGAEGFLEKSRKARRWRRLRRNLLAVLVAVLVLMLFGWKTRDTLIKQQEMIDKQDETIEGLKSEKEKLEKQVRSLFSGNESQLEQLSTLRQNHSNLLQENQTLRDGNAVLEIQIEDLRIENKELERTSEALVEESDTLSASIEAQKAELTDLQQERRTLTVKIEEVSTTRQALSLESEDLMRRLEALGVNLDEGYEAAMLSNGGGDPTPMPLPPEGETPPGNTSGPIDLEEPTPGQLRGEVQTLRERLAALERQREALLNEEAELQVAITQLEDEHTELLQRKESLEKERDELRTQQTDLLQVIGTLESQLQALQAETKALQSRIDAVQEEVRPLRRKYQLLRAEVRELRREIRRRGHFLMSETSRQLAVQSLTASDPENATILALRAYRTLERGQEEPAEVFMALFSAWRQLEAPSVERVEEELSRSIQSSYEFEEQWVDSSSLAEQICQLRPRAEAPDGERLCAGAAG